MTPGTRFLAYDAYALKNQAGIGAYTEQILTALLQQGRGPEMTVFTVRGPISDRFRSLPRSNEASEMTAPSWASHRVAFEELWLPNAFKRSGCGVLYNPDFTLPLAYRGRGVVTVHDLSIWDVPSSKSIQALLLYRAKVPTTLQKADRVIAVSKRIANDIVERHRVPPGKVVCIPNGVEVGMRPLPAPAAKRWVRKQHALVFPYVLGVGTVEPLKNWGLVTEALAASQNPILKGMHFVLCGGDGRQARRIKETLERRLPGRVHFLGVVTRTELRALYSACEVFVHPSRYDSFGLPVLEAMACGAPTAVSNAKSLPETAGGASLLFDPRDPVMLERAMVRLLRDRSLRGRLKRKGLKRARKLTWGSTAGKIWEVLRLVHQ